MNFDTKKAARSLVKHASSGDLVYVQVSVSRQISDRRLPTPVIIPLPHRYRKTADLTICLVTRDPQKKYTDVILNETSPAVETFSDIISISKLRRQLGSKKAKAEFRNRYDLVFAEVNVMDMLPEILGWDFYKSGRKMPLPIQLVNPKTKLVDARLARYQARKLTKSTALAVVPGTCLSVVAGTTSMDAKELVENIEAAARGVVERAGQVPVAGVHIKTAESMSLPIWTS